MHKYRNTSFWMQTALAIVETGSPGRAARQIGTSVTTIYRHIDALEASFGLRIFNRQHTGWHLRDEAQALLTTGHEIKRLLQTAESELRNAMLAEGGNLRISLPDDLAIYYMAARLGAFCETHKNIRPDLIIGSKFADIEHGEADVAIRPHMDPGDALIGHRVGAMTHAFYATDDYTKRFGRPSSLPELSDHRFCGYGADLTDYTAAQWLENHIPTENIAARFGTTALMARAVAAGIGIGLLPCFVGDEIPSVKAIMTVEGAMPIDIWLVTAAEGRKRPKIQAFFKFFGSIMRADKHLFAGQIYRN